MNEHMRGRRPRLAAFCAVCVLASLVAFVGPAGAAVPGDGMLGATPPGTIQGSTACPDGTTVTGVAGNIYGTIVGSVTVLCSDGAAGIVMGATVGSFGSIGCGVGETAVGIVGREDEFGIDQFALRCRASDLSGPTTASAELGNTGGFADGPYDCPEGQALTGLAGTLFAFQADNLVREVEIQCGPPSASVLPQVGLSASSLNFGDQLVGSTSAPHTVTLTNTAATGSDSLAVGQLFIGGADPGEFGLGSDGCSNTSLAPGASCTVDVRFAPTTAAARTASLSIPTNAVSSPDTVALGGNGTATPLADVKVGITGPSSALSGSQNTYVLNVSNAGPSSALDVNMTVRVPDGAKLVGVSSTHGSCAQAGAKADTIHCALGDLVPGAVAIDTVALKLALTGKGGSIAFVAQVSSATSDPDPSNNVASLVTTITKK
jgi:hypothetical protein